MNHCLHAILAFFRRTWIFSIFLLPLALGLLLNQIFKPVPNTTYSKIEFLGLEIRESSAAAAAGLYELAALIFAFVEWRAQGREKRNALLSAIEHELGVCFGVANTAYSINPAFADSNFPMSYIKRQKPDAVWENPSDASFFNQHHLWSQVRPASLPATKPRFLYPFPTHAIRYALTSGDLANVSEKRLFTNLAHLLYSIDRLNLFIHAYNLNRPIFWRKRFAQIRDEYFAWLHFRLHFTNAEIQRLRGTRNGA